MFVRWWLAPLLVSVLVVGGMLSIPSGERSEPPIETRAIAGGQIELPAGFEAGARFLRQVPLPDHVRNPPQADPENEVPGDGHDDGLLITQRRESHYGQEHLPLTGGLRIVNVHGTAENPICLCDATFVLWNKTSGFDPTRPVRIDDSSHILVDNITIYNGLIVAEESHNITITRSKFIDARGITSRSSKDVLIRDNDFIDHRGLLNWYDVPPVQSECWPQTKASCSFTGVEIDGGERVLVEHNYFDGEVGVGGTGDTRDVRLRHNTLYNGGSLVVARGDTEVGWNLVRGWGQHGVHVAGSTNGRIHNNSFILNTEVDLRDGVIDQWFGTYVVWCATCTVENNDYIGYGVAAQRPVRAMAQALRADYSWVDASDNYWATLHDPRLPPGMWIETHGTTTLVLDSWDLKPNHPVSIGVFLNPQDVPDHYRELTGDEWPIF